MRGRPGVRLAAGLFGAFVLACGAAAAAAAWWLPGWLQQRLADEASQRLGRVVTLERLELSWAAPGVTLHGLRVAAASPSAPPQFELGRVRLALSWASLPRFAPVVSALEVDAPRLRVARLEGGRTDLDDILARLAGPEPAPAAPASGPAPRFSVSGVRVAEGSVELDDRVVQQVFRLTGLRLEVPGLSTLEGPEAALAEPRLSFALDVTPVSASAAVRPFAAAPAATLSVSLGQALPLARLWGYLPAEVDGWPARPEGGRLALALQARVARVARAAQPAGQPLQWQLTGQASLEDMAWRPAPGRDPLVWKRLAVEGLDLSSQDRRLAVAAVRLDGPGVELGRDRRGRLTLGGWPLPTPGVSAEPGPAAQPAPPAPGSVSSPPAWRIQLGQLAISGARIGWTDGTTAPAARLRLEQGTLSAGPLAWPGGDPVAFEATGQVRGPAGPAGVLRVKGQGSTAGVRADAQLEGLQLEAVAPYLAATLRPKLDGRVGMAAAVQAQLEPTLNVGVRVQALRVEGLRLTEPGASTPAVQVSAVRVGDANLELPAGRLRVGSLRVESPEVGLVRASSGALNVESWAVAPASGPAAPPSAGTAPSSAGASARRTPATAAPAPSGSVRLDQFVVERARVRWRDETAEVRREDGKPLELSVAVPRLSAQALAWPPRREPAQVSVDVQVEPATAQDPPGRVQAEAVVELSAGRTRGSVTVERLPLHRVAPYVQAGLPVRVARAELGVRSRFDLALTPEGLQGQVDGQALLADVLLRSRVAGTDVRVGDELLSWQSLALGPTRAVLRGRERPQVEVQSIVLSDAYSRLVITEGGTFNLVDTVKAEGKSADGQAAAAAQAPAAAPAPAAASASASASAPWPLALTVGETRLVRGRVDFSDRFVKPNYSAALTELDGRLGRFSTEARDLPALELTGRAAGTAELQVRGSLNPTVNPPVLDLAARATGFELSTISTYSAKYAGYAIERGKLSLDVAYRIDPDGKLQARNQVVINQLTFGDKVESPDATKLPVRLAVALLTDRHGVIDLDLPVSGSINDPQFSVFGLVLKVLGNLIVKAVTAPFAWLTGGGGEQASVVEFAPGTAVLAHASGHTLERVARALKDRPALRMTVTGAADPVSEREAMQADALAQRLQAEQRRELARAGRALAADAPLPHLGPQERLRLLQRLYDETDLPDKPRDARGQPQAVPAEQMEAMLRRTVLVSTDTARELAIRRGLAVREALVAHGLSAERLFLGAPRLRVSGEDDAAWTPRVQLAISAP